MFIWIMGNVFPAERMVEREAFDVSNFSLLVFPRPHWRRHMVRSKRWTDAASRGSTRKYAAHAN